MDRKAKLTQGLDLRHSRGIEIGALANPVVSRDLGDVLYVDYTDTASLQARYANDPLVRTEDIVQVDAIWGSKTLAEAVAPAENFDYVIASHVVEHVPDLIAWLNELCDVIKPEGQIRLVVPDRRYSFDYLREETRAADVLSAHLVKARIPQPHEILDFTLNKTTVDVAQAWAGSLDRASLPRDFTVEGALCICRDAMENGTYHDVHCWVFTPKSFAKLMYELCSYGMIDLACAMFEDTEHEQLEFFVGMQRCADKQEQLASWLSMANRATGQIEPSMLKADAQRAKGNAANKDAIIEELSASLKDTRLALEEMRLSRSWKVTAPLRKLARLFRRR